MADTFTILDTDQITLVNNGIDIDDYIDIYGRTPDQLIASAKLRSAYTWHDIYTNC